MKPSTRNPIVRRALTGVAAMAIAGGAFVGGAAPAIAEDEPPLDTCDLSKKVDQLQKYGSDTSKNIIVYKKGNEESANFGEIEDEGVISEWGCEEVQLPPNDKDEFRYVVFSGNGEIKLDGDGGYRNWAFAGDFDRPSDKHVTFNAR